MSLHQPELFPKTLYLRRIDPAANMRSFYRIRIGRNLFEWWELVREWERAWTPSVLQGNSNSLA